MRFLAVQTTHIFHRTSFDLKIDKDLEESFCTGILVHVPLSLFEIKTDKELRA